MSRLPSAKDLAYFHEVAITLHISRAAKKLNVTQPSLSLAIKRLETQLNTPLFIRHGQGVTLTRAGDELFREVKTLLLFWEKTTTNIRNANESIKGKVTIGCHSTLAPFMSNMVANLLSQHSELEIHFEHDLSPKIMEQVIKGHIDIGIVTDPFPHPGVIIQPITHTEFGFWVSIKHENKINLYAEETVIICDPKLSPTQYLIKQLINKNKCKELRFNTMNQIEAIAMMATEGYGVGILPSSFTKTYFGDKLKLVPNAPIYKKPLCLSYRTENKYVKAIQLVLKEIKKLV